MRRWLYEARVPFGAGPAADAVGCSSGARGPRRSGDVRPRPRRQQRARRRLAAARRSAAAVRGARVPVRQPDGSLAGPAAHPVVASPSDPVMDEALYTEPGYWSCVARGTAENAGPWSEPTPLTFVQADYRGLYSPMKLG